MEISVIVRTPLGEPQAEALGQGLARLRAAGHTVALHETGQAGDAARFAKAASDSGVDLVIAAGGDGTINEVVNGLASTTAPPPRLAVVPFGTANDFARGLGIPFDAGAALGIAVGGQAVAIDIGKVNERYFLNVSTGGFGADASADAPRELKRLLGPFAYLMRGAQQLIRLRPQQARFVVDGEVVHDGGFLFFAVGNGGQTGGGTRIAPRASVRDGRLDVVVVKAVSRLEFLALLPDLRRGTHLDSPDVLYVRARRFEVIADDPIATNVDGEPLRARHYVYELSGRRLEVATPRRAMDAAPSLQRGPDGGSDGLEAAGLRQDGSGGSRSRGSRRGGRADRGAR